MMNNPIETLFIRAIRDCGIAIDSEIIADGQLHRAHVDGDKPGSVNAWYVLHDGDFAAGAFGCNKRGIAGKWRANGKRQPLTQCDRERIEGDRRARTEAQERIYGEAATRAERILQQATRDASEHGYVTLKGIQAHGVGMNGHNLLVIPIYSALTGQLQTVQLIDRNGGKKMLTNGRTKNGCFPFQYVPNFWANAQQKTGIGEGWATCATLAESLPETAMFCAFSAGNLANVANALRARYPDAEITIFGDNDVSGTGQRYAAAAASAIGGRVAIPPIPGHDWNDYAMRAAA